MTRILKLLRIIKLMRVLKASRVVKRQAVARRVLEAEPVLAVFAGMRVRSSLMSRFEWQLLGIFTRRYETIII